MTLRYTLSEVIIFQCNLQFDHNMETKTVKTKIIRIKNHKDLLTSAKCLFVPYNLKLFHLRADLKIEATESP